MNKYRNYVDGDYVSYRRQGAYRICGIKDEDTFGEVRSYFVLKSVYDSNNALYVPLDSDELMGELRDVLTKNEIDKIIADSYANEPEWCPVLSERKEKLMDIYKEGTLCKMISMMRLLSEKKAENRAKKTKTPANDEKMFSMYQKRISEAFAFSLGIGRDEVFEYIEKQNNGQK